MNWSEVINIIVSVVSILIALLALLQTKQQISLSNKQQLFERRLSCYLEFNMFCSLYSQNKLYLKDDSTFFHINDLIFSWLANCSNLEKMTSAVFAPMHQEEQRIFLAKYEQLKNSAIEISMIFDGDIARIARDFTSLFADLLKAMYQQQVYIRKLKEQEKQNGIPLDLEDYEDKCKKMAESLGIFQIRDSLEHLKNEIDQKKVAEEMENRLRLTKVKK